MLNDEIKKENIYFLKKKSKKETIAMNNVSWGNVKRKHRLF